MTHWWSCTRCPDRMASSFNPDDVIRDQRAHIRKNHPGWQPSRIEAMLSHWYLPIFMD